MDIYWYGHAMFKIKGKYTTLVIDPFDPEFTGLKFPKDNQATVVLCTHNHQDHNNFAAIEGHPMVIAGPGEYEISGVSINGISAPHDTSNGSERGLVTIYDILIDGIHITHLGDLGDVLTEDQVSQIDETDILMIPVGGHATIGAKTAAKIITELEPSIVLPMHYHLPDLKFELDNIEPFLKEMGAENLTPLPKLTVTKDKLPEETTVVLLNKN